MLPDDTESDAPDRRLDRPCMLRTGLVTRLGPEDGDGPFVSFAETKRDGRERLGSPPTG